MHHPLHLYGQGIDLASQSQISERYIQELCKSMFEAKYPGLMCHNNLVISYFITQRNSCSLAAISNSNRKTTQTFFPPEVAIHNSLARELIVDQPAKKKQMKRSQNKTLQEIAISQNYIHVTPLLSSSHSYLIFLSLY